MHNDIWVPKIGKKCSTEREPDNPDSKYAVYVNKNDRIMGPSVNRKSGNFAETIFYFLRAKEYSLCKTVITGKPINLDDGDGMQVPWSLQGGSNL